ncbi:Protein transport protein Sec16A, partial [Ophiophagus hannah]
MPAASTCCGDEKWGDWRPHLAMVLSNLTNNTDVESRTIVTMGDTLASKGLLDAAHFCYLMAQEGFGVYTKKTTKLVLIGANHRAVVTMQPCLRGGYAEGLEQLWALSPTAVQRGRRIKNSSLDWHFASNEAIQRTETYEYAQSLGTQPCSLPNFQVFKFLYACRLAEMGLIAQAFHYCEVISKAILTNPGCYSPVLIAQVIQISSQLRLFDPQIKEKPEQELFIEPKWLIQLRHLDGQIKTPPARVQDPKGTVRVILDSCFIMGCKRHSLSILSLAPPTILDGSVALTPPAQQEPAAAVPFYSMVPTSVGPGPGSLNPYGAEMNPMYGGPAVLPADLPPQGPELQPHEGTQHEAGVAEPPVWKAVPKSGEEDFYAKMASMSGGHWLRWLMGKSKNEAHLPDDKNKSIVWDEKKQRWINLDEPEEESKPPPPPPTGFPQAAPSGLAGPPNASVNVFSRRAAGSKVRYVDILNPSKATSPVPAPAPADLFAPLAPMPIPTNMFVPNSGELKAGEKKASKSRTPETARPPVRPSVHLPSQLLFFSASLSKEEGSGGEELLADFS